jgi:hypothetical protein
VTNWSVERGATSSRRRGTNWNNKRLARLQVAGLPRDRDRDLVRLRDLFDQIVALAVSSIKTTKARHLPVKRRR